MCILYNQRDATYTMRFNIISDLHVSVRPSSGAYKTVCATLGIVMLSTAGVDGFQPIHTSGRQQESMTIPKVAHTVL